MNNSKLARVLYVLFILGLALLAVFATQLKASAGENLSNKSTSSIDWGFTNSYSLIPNTFSAVTTESDDYASGEENSELGASAVGQVAMYRLYNKWSGEHFYTADKAERDNLVKIGWTNENVGWVTPVKSNTPVYRLYNPYCAGGDHHYTASTKEYSDLKKAGWVQEGMCWYSVDYDSVYKTAIYRQYNHYQYSCNHNYTIDTAERDKLIKAGWNDEGISYYGLDFRKMTDLDFSKITVDTSTKIYSGKQYKPSVTSTTLKAGSDYVVTYGANINAGTGTITVSGTGSYYGKKTYTFKINPYDISKATVTLGNTLTYNTKEQIQTIKSVKVSVFNLGISDYDVSGNKGTNAGIYTLKISGKGNFTGSVSKNFNIAKANPTYTIPTGLQGYLESQLSTVSIKDQLNGKFSWNNPSTVFSQLGKVDANKFSATFTPNDTKNYNTVTNVMIPVEVLENYFEATFVANAPDGCTVTFDGVSIDNDGTVVKNLKYADVTATVKQSTLSSSVYPSVENASDGSDYFFCGWAPKSDAKYGTMPARLEDESITRNVTYYAIWKTPSGYWLGSANADEDYDGEAYFAKNDPNYRTDAEIADDMKILHNANDSSYETIKAKWDIFYDNGDAASDGVNNKVRLYATYEGGETEGSRDTSSTDYDQGEPSVLNKYVEFRILEVSGATGHKNSETETDGSAVTFLATHALPTAYQMKAENVNEGGWGASDLFDNLNSGTIYGKFASDFKGAVLAVPKKYNKGNGASATSETGEKSSQFWIPSYAELVNPDATDFSENLPKNEGTQYAWCAANVKNASSNNDCLAYKTRAGKYPGRCISNNCHWYLRSPTVSDIRCYAFSDYVGTPDNFGSSVYARGVTPAFCF